VRDNPRKDPKQSGGKVKKDFPARIMRTQGVHNVADADFWFHAKFEGDFFFCEKKHVRDVLPDFNNRNLKIASDIM
jgi:hypothetical protein